RQVIDQQVKPTFQLFAADLAVAVTVQAGFVQSTGELAVARQHAHVVEVQHQLNALVVKDYDLAKHLRLVIQRMRGQTRGKQQQQQRNPSHAHSLQQAAVPCSL